MRPFLALSDAYTLANGAVKAVNDDTLKNPYDSLRGYYIDEIGFAPMSRDSGLALTAQFTWANERLCGPAVPVVLLGTPRTVRQSLNAPAFTWADVYEYKSWILPKPLYVPPGQRLICTLRHAGIISTTTITAVRVCYSGRSLENSDPIPSKVALPWSTAWIGASQAGGSQYTEESGPADLFNPHQQPLNITQFSANVGINDNYPLPSTSPWAKDVRVRLYSPSGNIAVRDNAVLGQVFHRGTWNVSGTLAPHKYYSAILEEDYRDRADLTYTGSVITTVIAMTGYREVSL